MKISKSECGYPLGGACFPVCANRTQGRGGNGSTWSSFQNPGQGGAVFSGTQGRRHFYYRQQAWFHLYVAVETVSSRETFSEPTDDNTCYEITRLFRMVVFLISIVLHNVVCILS